MASAELKTEIDTIEAGYEYMLAYAAQGLEKDQASPHQEEVVRHLNAMDKSLSSLATLATQQASEVDGDKASQYQSFLQALQHDTVHAQGAIRLVLCRSGISSQLIDNLNASSHVRALLTDLFLLDEALTHGR